MIEVMRGPLPGATRKNPTATTTSESSEKEIEEAKPDENESQTSYPSVLPIDKATVMQTHRVVVGAVTSEGALKQAVAAFQST